MTDADPSATQRDVDVAIELSAAGFEDAAEIGRGGFGVVYRCEQEDLERTVAVKVLTSNLDPENLARFIREQRAMGRMSGHPNIVDIYQVGVTRTKRPFLVMPYHSRGSLDARIRRDGPLEWPEVVRLGVKIAGALETAHLGAALHRDVKPANILLTDYGEPQLTDFGIARISGGFETSTGSITGSPAFTAPEVLEGRPPAPESDVYSLGATLFCALTGHAAHERRSGEQIVAQFLRITSHPVPDLREGGFPHDLATVIEHAMARAVENRPSSAAELGDELRAVQQRHGLPVDQDLIAHDINYFLNRFRDHLALIRPHDPIPDIDGRPWRFTTRQFRRTVAWHIARQPFGVVAGKIQYKYVRVAIFEGYAGTSASGFRSEVEDERALAQLDSFLDQYEDFIAGVRTPPRLAEQFGQIRAELGDLPGRVVDRARVRAMLANTARTYFPGILNDCYFDPATALCLPQPSAATEPVTNHCRPELCRNSCVTTAHAPAIRTVIADATELMAVQRLSAPQRDALKKEISTMTCLLAPIDGESPA
ncbi:serine/threonine protein kinase [Rhodococcus koreensis]|nr:serine/threonine protein kinase [Rhodococcus koreensis]